MNDDSKARLAAVCHSHRSTVKTYLGFKMHACSIIDVFLAKKKKTKLTVFNYNSAPLPPLTEDNPDYSHQMAHLFIKKKTPQDSLSLTDAACESPPRLYGIHSARGKPEVSLVLFINMNYGLHTHRRFQREDHSAQPA